ncbi:hypothetical protein [Aquabacter cavernae]|uniref:hypothetical protein n=1 Tax=Aquabacter cavernae TaxID=2496029 RepID=UPI000F8D1A11|nr:hypothetical protein [Aquabacter cavernae]
MSANGFMGFWSDIDADYRLRYREWHNCEHMPERVGIRGFIEGRRYRAASDGHDFFMCYVTEGPEVLTGPDYLGALNRPTPWTKEALTHFRNPERSLYRRVGTLGVVPDHAPYIVLVRFNDARSNSDLLGLLERAFGTAGGDRKVSLYDMDTDGSKIMTAERRIYSAGPGERQYLVAAELTERGAAQKTAEQLVRLLDGANDLHVALYWLEMRVRSADVTPYNQKIEETP